MKERKLKCSFCEAKVIKIREGFAFRMGLRIRKIRITGGYLLISTFNSRLPICSNCWYKASVYLEGEVKEKE